MKKIDKTLIKTLIEKEDPIILDIGCYDGRDSFELSQLFKTPTIFCLKLTHVQSSYFVVFSVVAMLD